MNVHRFFVSVVEVVVCDDGRCEVVGYLDIYFNKKTYNSCRILIFFYQQGHMNYLAIFEGKTSFNGVWLLLDVRAELDLRSTNYFNLHVSLIRLCSVIKVCQFHMMFSDFQTSDQDLLLMGPIFKFPSKANSSKSGRYSRFVNKINLL